MYNTFRKQASLKSQIIATDLQLRSPSSFISNPHTKEDGNRPIPQLARDDKQRYLRLVLAGQMQLQEEGGHAQEAGQGDDEKGSGRFALDHGAVLGCVV